VLVYTHERNGQVIVHRRSLHSQLREMRRFCARFAMGSHKNAIIFYRSMVRDARLFARLFLQACITGQGSKKLQGWPSYPHLGSREQRMACRSRNRNAPSRLTKQPRPRERPGLFEFVRVPGKRSFILQIISEFKRFRDWGDMTAANAAAKAQQWKMEVRSSNSHWTTERSTGACRKRT
jgi:hypothetical protein